MSFSYKMRSFSYAWKRYLSPFLLLGLFSFSGEDEIIYPTLDALSVKRGEVLEFKVNFSFIPVGKAQMRIGPKLHKVNERECYKVDIYGKTTGAFDWVAKVNDHWGGYIDTAAALPHISYRNIEEGNYRKKEVVHFDHKTNMIEAKSINNKTGLFKEPLYHQAPDNVRDMVSGYMYLRAIDFSSVQENDTLMVQAFFEDTFYDLKVLFKGREEISTRLGKIRTLKLVPVMPDNSLFDGENAISAWISDDENKLPVRVNAELVIGHAEVEIISAEGVKHPINFVKTKKAGEGVNAPSQIRDE